MSTKQNVASHQHGDESRSSASQDRGEFPCLCEVVDLAAPSEYPFCSGDVVLMLGEIAQMPGHVAIALKDGRVLFGYHVENFRRLSDEEA